MRPAIFFLALSCALAAVARVLKTAVRNTTARSPHDIDLYSGALSENTVAGGSVGQTYACLIGMQFKSLKYGDRFWYERTSSEGFTASQLAELKKMTLSGVLCEAFDDQLQSIQPSAFRLPNINGRNIPVPCSQIRRMSLDAW